MTLTVCHRVANQPFARQHPIQPGVLARQADASRAVEIASDAKDTVKEVTVNAKEVIESKVRAASWQPLPWPLPNSSCYAGSSVHLTDTYKLRVFRW